MEFAIRTNSGNGEDPFTNRTVDWVVHRMLNPMKDRPPDREVVYNVQTYLIGQLGKDRLDRVIDYWPTDLPSGDWVVYSVDPEK